MSNSPKARLGKGKRSEPTTAEQFESVPESKKPRQVSAESTSSMFDPMNFEKGSVDVKGPLQVSTESTSSMFDPMNFSKGPKQDLTASTSSMFDPMNFSKGPQQDLAASTASMFDPMNFQINPKSVKKTVETTDPSGISMPSEDSSMYTLPIAQEFKRLQNPECCVCEEAFDDDPVYFTCRHVACTCCVIKETETVKGQSQTTDQYHCTVCGTNQTIAPNQQALKLLTLDRQLFDMIEKLKKEKSKQFSLTSEGNGDEKSPLNHIYTSLSVNFGKREFPRVHYLRQMYQKKKTYSQEEEVDLSSLFESSPTKVSRTILTNGTAGIGKSFSVQKFIVDWAEDISNKDVHFVFSLSFRELNLIKEYMSLLQLLKMFHPAVSELKPQDLDFTKVILILDGFDESRFLLNFSDKQKVSSVQETASVPSLLINLIQGNLLPKAQLWITSRPAASYQIPGEFIHKVTEIQGFNDQQKEEYFTKKFKNNPDVAKMVISHIQSSPTMDMLCQIPIFCWMSSVLLEEVFGGEEQTEAPQTLTEMMGAFLFVQTKRSSKKYDKNPERERSKLLKAKRDFLLKLGKLAFIHLLRNSLIFYEEDLKQCGLDPKEVTVNSGFFNSVLRADQLFLQQKVYYFVHLTIQEFFAALYVYDCFTNNTDWAPELSDFLGLENSEPSSRPSVLDLLKTTVTKVLERNSGHLFFFQRFLLGLVVESNQKCLHGLLVPVKSGQETVGKMLGHLKAIRRKTVSPDACINLFQSMVEMGDVKINEEIQEYLKNEDRARIVLTPLHCSALAFTIQVSKSVFEELDLKSYNTSEEGRRRLIPAVRSSRKANLSDCKVSEAFLKPLALALSLPHSSLRDLDLTNSDLGDSGVELLCEGLKSPVCKLKILNLSGCLVTEAGCGFLVSALKSNPSHIMELDLSYNNLGSGETALNTLKSDPQYNLSHLQLNLSHSGSHRMIPGLKKYWCDLSWDSKQTHAGVKLSEEQRKVSRSEEGPDCVLVWGGQGLSGRCYWEIEASEPFNIGVAYKSRDLEKAEFRLGQNENSWSLGCSEEGCYVFSNNRSTAVTVPCSRSSRRGVYLDHPAGVLSFYRVSADSRILLRTFREKFTKDLFPAADLRPKSSAKFYREPEQKK
uniref:Uncharacterized protein n=1 Tax=Neogobius melanostomus TaxID=47308 RepID=A0A8C6TR70_9GOBI